MAAVAHTRSKAVAVALWIPTVLAAALFASAALEKLTGAALGDFTRWGYGGAFMTVVGVVELASAVAILVPRVALAGAVGMVGVLVGALVTIALHLGADAARLPLTVVALGAALLIGAARRREFLGGYGSGRGA